MRIGLKKDTENSNPRNHLNLVDTSIVRKLGFNLKFFNQVNFNFVKVSGASPRLPQLVLSIQKTHSKILMNSRSEGPERRALFNGEFKYTS